MIGDLIEKFLVPELSEDKLANVDSFHEYVENAEKLRDPTLCEITKCQIFGKTPVGQQFSIVINEKIDEFPPKYVVSVYMDEDHRDKTGLYLFQDEDYRNQNSYYIEQRQFRRKDDAFNMLEDRKLALESKRFKDLYAHIKPRIRKIPDECAILSAKHLNPGDHLQSNFVVIHSSNLASHEGIYIGDGKVVHVSGHNTTKTAARARVGDLFGNFCHTETDEIRVIVHRLRTKKPSEIVDTARRLAEENYRDGEYHLLGRNCQHFAHYCAKGMENSPDADRAERTLNYFAYGIRKTLGWVK